ncbi:glutamate receptor 2.8-like [Senna tora]|uniref:Glutamate receptor 2.8-like n=1 Tax=Senna tora TaxID=362788 RepID=A0A834TRB6_9FABA|nr:glutamate receptor 2.8-like [Senna tora]
MAQNCIRLGLSDFYNHNNASYAITLSLHIRDTHNDIVTAASAALDLIDNQNVHAIIGPQNSGEARFVAEIGTKAQIPIISFSATSPSLSPSQTPYFVRTTQSDLSEVEAICAIAQAYGWHKIILISENTEYGNGLIPYLAAALGEINIQVPYKTSIDPHSQEAEISKEVKKLKGMQTKVFLVHMSADVGSNFFRLVNSAGMMREGYAWMVTQEMSAKMNPMGPKVMGYMQGVLGVRPMVKKTKGLEDLNRRWKAMANAYNKSSVLSLFGIWAYDTVQALALAVDKVGIANSTFQKSNMTNKSRDKYVMGPRLLNTILDTKLKGLSGNFNLVEGQLEPSVLEVFNVIGRKERIIGYWSPQMGLFRDLDEDGVPMAKGKLKQPIWPGDTIEPPTVLRIGVPVRQSFTEFVKVERGSPNGTSKISGFSIDVFLEAIKVLPFSFRYEFVPLTNKNGTTGGNYDELLCQIKEKASL